MSFWKKTNKADVDDGFQAGLTPRSFFACALCLLLAGMYTQFSMVINGECYMIPESATPIPAMIVLFALVVLVGIVGSLFKLRILSKAEIVCIGFATLMAVPMMTQGFWHRFLGITSAPLRNGCFDYLDAYDDSLWPHGPNMLAGSFDVANPQNGLSQSECGVTMTAGAESKNVSWSEVEYEEGVKAVLPTISNTVAGEESVISFSIPVVPGDDSSMVPANPHLASVLVRTDNLDADAEVFCRAFADDNPVPVPFFATRKADKKTYLHKMGFVRVGVYGVRVANCYSNVTVQLGLKGRGSATFADPKLMSVYALETAFTGRKEMLESEYNALPVEKRPVGVVIRPDNLWSFKGLTYFFKGFIPIREWIKPALVWGAYMLMLFMAFFSINVMMRKKWAESERYPMPNTKVPLALIGAEDKVDSPFSQIWKNRYAWWGLAIAVVYAVLKGAHYYNPRLPDLTIDIRIGDYVSNPVFGGMFNVSFIFSLFVCSIAIFFELNVLLSIVVGFWLVRCVFFLGHVTTIDVNSGFPWFQQQAVGAYIGYFLVVMALSWKYIWGIIKSAFKGTGKEPGDILSPRIAVILFILSHVGIVFWALYTGSSVASMLVMFCFLVLVGFVAAKYRAECGSPFGYFTPYNSMVFVAVCGGIATFGTSGMLVSLILSGFLTVTVFFLIPGIQFEAIQIGKRMKIRPRHIAYTCLLGLAGGLFVGGWVFLSNAYSMGGDNIKFQWAFNGLNWFMNQYRTVLNQASVDWLREASDSAVNLGPNWETRAMVTSGGIMVVLTLLRQFFAGFWFHPLGFLLGFTNLNDGANWGTLLVAWAIRALVLKIGGANAVRSKLQPFFIGVFAGCLIGIMIFTVVNSMSAASGSPLFYPDMP